LKVKATQPGFMFGRRIRVGEVFNLPEGFTAGKHVWYKPVADKEPKEVAKPKAKEPQTFSEMSKLDGKAMDPKETGPKAK
jgi:hypothetical protein